VYAAIEEAAKRGRTNTALPPWKPALWAATSMWAARAASCVSIADMGDDHLGMDPSRSIAHSDN
jgi:hypothetical protein